MGTGPLAMHLHNGCMLLTDLHHAHASLQDNGVATLTFRNAGSLNILSSPVLEDLAQALDTLAQDSRIRVLVLQSLQPVVEHLDQSRRQQLGLHRVLLQVAARLQEQIDQQRAGRLPVQPTLQADDIDKAFDRMQDPRPPA